MRTPILAVLKFMCMHIIKTKIERTRKLGNHQQYGELLTQ